MWALHVFALKVIFVVSTKFFGRCVHGLFVCAFIFVTRLGIAQSLLGTQLFSWNFYLLFLRTNIGPVCALWYALVSCVGILDPRRSRDIAIHFWGLELCTDAHVFVPFI